MSGAEQSAPADQFMAAEYTPEIASAPHEPSHYDGAPVAAESEQSAAGDSGAESTEVLAGVEDGGTEPWSPREEVQPEESVRSYAREIDEAIEESLAPSAEANVETGETSSVAAHGAEEGAERSWFDEEESGVVAGDTPAADGTILFEERLDVFSSLPTHSPTAEPVMSHIGLPHEPGLPADGEGEDASEAVAGDAAFVDAETSAVAAESGLAEAKGEPAPSANTEPANVEAGTVAAEHDWPGAGTPPDLGQGEAWSAGQPEVDAAPPEDTLSALSGEFGEPPTAAEEAEWGEPEEPAIGELPHAAAMPTEPVEEAVAEPPAASVEGDPERPGELERLEQLKEIEPWSVAAPEPTEPSPGEGVAEALERIARRVREGTLIVPADAESATDETALAMALAALLRQGGGGR